MAVLLFAGLGSGFSRRFGPRALAAIQRAALAVIGVLALHVLLVPFLQQATLGWSLALRIAMAIGMVAPLAFGLGMSFPLGLGEVGKRGPVFIPWAWGINSGFTVIGSILAILLAMAIGFEKVLLMAALCYAAAPVAFGRYLASTAER